MKPGKKLKMNFEVFLKDFTCFECMRKKKRTANRGSGGIAVFIRDGLLKSGGIKRIFEYFTECVVLWFSADVFHRENDLILFFTYVAPENSPIYADEGNGIVLLNNKISEVVSEYPNAEIFLAGDLNSRISDFQDFIPSDDLQFVFGETDYPSDTFDIPRKSKDENYNRFGRSLIDLCCIYDIHVLNGRLFNDINGEITCTANEGSSIVDCMVASSSLFESILHFQVGNEDFSDHFPLKCTLTIGHEANRTYQYDHIENLNSWQKFKWREELKTTF